MTAPVAGVLMSGSQSRRMGGGDKCLRPLAGQPILAHVIARVRPQVGSLVLNANGDAARFAAFAGAGFSCAGLASVAFAGVALRAGFGAARAAFFRVALREAAGFAAALAGALLPEAFFRVGAFFFAGVFAVLRAVMAADPSGDRPW